MKFELWHFSSPDCLICTTQIDVLENIKNEYGIQFKDMPITSNFDSALSLGVQSAPTLVYITGNQAVKIRPGFQSKNNILAEIEKLQRAFLD